jgi:NitT/TauT family transport system substrate-binding protein
MQYTNSEKFLKKLSLIILVIIICFALSLFVGCDNNDNVVRLNEVTHSLFYAPQYLAMALGYFDEVGISVEITNGSGADNVMTALLTNEADIGLMGCETNIYVYLQGKKDYPKVIGQLTKRDGSFLIARSDIENFSYQDMENTTILMGRKGGMPAMILQYVLNNKGYTNGININMDYSIQFSALAPAFTGGTGDFVPLFEPAASQMVKEGKGYIVSAIGMDSGEIPYTCYTATSTFLKNHGDRAEKFLRAVWLGTEYVLSHSATECANLVAPYFDGTSLDLIVSAIENYKKYDVWTTTPITDRTAFSRIQDIMQNAGELTTRVNYEDIVDNTYANNI